jgi:blue copper oxidase
MSDVHTTTSFSAVSSAAVFLRPGFAVSAARFETPLPIPQLIDAGANNNAVSLTIAQGVHAFRPGKPVKTFGYSAPVLGPVLHVRRGASTQFAIENQMDRATTLHWHGLVIPAAVDGGPHHTIKSGARWNPVLWIDHPETTVSWNCFTPSLPQPLRSAQCCKPPM